MRSHFSARFVSGVIDLYHAVRDGDEALAVEAIPSGALQISTATWSTCSICGRALSWVRC